MWYFVWQSQETNKRGVVFSTLSDVQRDAKTLLNDEAMAKVVKEILKKIRKKQTKTKQKDQDRLDLLDSKSSCKVITMIWHKPVG